MALKDDDWMRLDALGMAALVKERKVSSRELVDFAINRIERLNPSINAVVRLEADRGRSMVKPEPGNGPFEGVPFLLKEAGPVEKDQQISFGCRFFDGFSSPVDATLIERYRATGLVSLGRTSTPELGLCPATEPALYGPCRNPWNLKMQSGGSSGGAAAALAARMVPIVQGSDGGGSIRLPSSHSGVYGL